MLFMWNRLPFLLTSTRLDARDQWMFMPSAHRAWGGAMGTDERDVQHIEQRSLPLSASVHVHGKGGEMAPCYRCVMSHPAGRRGLPGRVDAPQARARS